LHLQFGDKVVLRPLSRELLAPKLRKSIRTTLHIGVADDFLAVAFRGKMYNQLFILNLFILVLISLYIFTFAVFSSSRENDYTFLEKVNHR
jgi:hypothetical protein